MRSESRLDRDTRTLLLKYIRKYEEYRTWYMAEREKAISIARILNPAAGNSTPSNPVLRAVEALDKIEQTHRAKVVKAVYEAKIRIGKDISSERERLALRRAIWLSCIDGRRYNFEAFAGLICYERTIFYRSKNQFLSDVKEALGI